MENLGGGYDFMFCQICGTMLSFKSHKHAECSLCGFKRPAKEFAKCEISYTVTEEDFRRDLNKLEPFIKVKGSMNVNFEVTMKQSNEICGKCNKAYMNFTERQTRSADEGMTVTYHCPNCPHTETRNT
ncbi:hypothetical protein IFM89_034054 [Coptis chinensis]|uniref:DNA-directed RNA polymerase subunit n=1 Tax=Coptis chinensis TaxID=261450 RepID=A0A835ISK3_9MAGN|nr:hypothetical protein IFM89_034054 [Coptis chinensis]